MQGDLAMVKRMLAASRVEVADSRWSAQSIVKGASELENDASKALTAVSRDATDTTIQKAAIIG